MVNFDGVIYKCPAFIGKEGLATGDVRNGIDDCTYSYKLGLWKNNEECKKCVYLPLCFGGCPVIEKGALNTLECRKAYLDATLETFIK